MTAGLVEEASGNPEAESADRKAGRPSVRTVLWAIAPHLAYVLLAVAVTARLWVHRDIRLLEANPTDHQQFLWFLANAAHSLAHGSNLLVTDQLNVPGKVNLMANTSILGLGVPLAPVTLMFGPAVSFTVALAITLAGTASAWYWLLSRHVVDSRLAAFVGAGFCGFAPGMISQAGGHPNLTAQFLIPLIVWRVIRLGDAGRVLRNGIILGLLVTYQVFLNEELLFLTALACAVFIPVYALLRWPEVRDRVRPFFAGLGVTAGVAGVLLAYPLWVQFFGPGHYRGLPPGVDRYVTDLASFPAFARRTLVGSTAGAAKVTMSATEENAFLGWPLFLFVIAAAAAMWRRAAVKALVATGLVFAVLSLGAKITFYGHKTQIPAPLRVLRHIPPFELATATRYALGVVPVVGVLIAVAFAALLRRAGTDWRRRAVAIGVVAAVLLPIAPRPLLVVERPVPAFILSGEWKQYVDHAHTLVAVPVPRNDQQEGMRWAALTNIGFAVPRGYFMGPRSATDLQNVWDAPPRHTSSMLATVAKNGKVPVITGADRAAARDDLRFWRAGLLVVSSTEPFATALVATVTALVGPGTWDEAGGVWRWDVRAISDSTE